jgi:hypothetical protein
MATLFNTKIKDTYQSLLKLEDNTILTTTTKNITDGLGNASPLFMSTTQVRIGSTSGSAMYWDNVNNRLGVGTSSPTSTLSVNGSISGTSLSLSGTLQGTGTGDNYLKGSGFTIQSATNNTDNGFYISTASLLEKKVLFLAKNLGSYGRSDLYLCINGDATATNASISDSKVVFKANGNVLIGTTTDSGYKLDVNGTARVSGAVTGGNGSNFNDIYFYGGGDRKIKPGVNQLDITDSAGVSGFQVGGSGGFPRVALGYDKFDFVKGLGNFTISASGSNQSLTLNLNGQGANHLTPFADIVAQGYAFSAPSGNNTTLRLYTTNTTSGTYGNIIIGHNGTNATGNVGIGTSSPTNTLSIKQLDSNTSMLRLDSASSVGSNTYQAGIDFYSRITLAGGTDSYPVGKIYGIGGGEFRQGSLRFQTIITNGGSLTDTMTLFQGNVGIGSLNTTPSKLLQVTGLKDTVVADFSSNTVGINEGVSIQLSAEKGNYLLGVIRGIYSANGGFSAMTFSTTNSVTITEAIRITSSQNVLIGTTTDSGYKLDVNGTTRVNGVLTVGNSSITGNFGAMILSNNGVAGVSLSFTNSSFGSNNPCVLGDQGTNAHSSAQVEIKSSGRGFLPPRMTFTQRNAIATPATGLQVFDTNQNAICEYTGTAWRTISGGKQVNNATTGATTIDLSAGNVADVTLTLSTVITLTNPTVGTYVIKLIQDAIGGKVVSWPFNVLWSGGTPPTLTATANKTDVITLMYDGVNYYGTYALNF